MIDATGRLVRDTFFVFVDLVNWLWDKLWKFNRSLAKTLLPGQSRGIQTTVALVAVCGEIIGLWVFAVDFADRHPMF
ncbi:hypothetical protein [Kineosporia sp. NBRC 101731]|uniref:hypothetical protein n=1 Tax=Kineosporia sp. NBRC 101731 TaxID=3032199 RepID=UPI0024A06079|nr:hypothetical protein [Kineosporia sp. NBRC 101731]GLY27033.1 hypothetical protein Kisp02_03980 [Kineosporia sp. NBRC 101731]